MSDEQIQLLTKILSQASAVAQGTTSIASQLVSRTNSKNPSRKPSPTSSRDSSPYRQYTRPLKKGSPVPQKSATTSSSQYLVSNEQLYDQIQKVSELLQKHHSLVTEYSTSSQLENRILNLLDSTQNSNSKIKSETPTHWWSALICILLGIILAIVILIAQKQGVF